MHVLGLDPSLTNFGWAVHDHTAKGVARCVERGRFQTSSKQLFVTRYMEMRESVIGLVQRLGITRVGCEYPVFNDLWSEGMYGLFLYTCEALYQCGVDLVFFAPPQVKGHARLFLKRPSPQGRVWVMRKPDMVEAARLDAGDKGNWNHNEADAYWVAIAASRFWLFLDGVIQLNDLTPVERSQFTKIHTFQRGKRAGQTKKQGILYREDERFFRWAKPEDEINADSE